MEWIPSGVLTSRLCALLSGESAPLLRPRAFCREQDALVMTVHMHAAPQPCDEKAAAPRSLFISFHPYWQVRLQWTPLSAVVTAGEVTVYIVRSRLFVFVPRAAPSSEGRLGYPSIYL